MTEKIEPLTMPVWPDAGRALGLGRNAIYEAVARGDVPSIRIGKRILIPRAALAKLLGGAGPAGE
jgi:excisionase family DNA binding protein